MGDTHHNSGLPRAGGKIAAILSNRAEKLSAEYEAIKANARTIRESTLGKALSVLNDELQLFHPTGENTFVRFTQEPHQARYELRTGTVIYHFPLREMTTRAVALISESPYFGLLPPHRLEPGINAYLHNLKHIHSSPTIPWLKELIKTVENLMPEDVPVPEGADIARLKTAAIGLYNALHTEMADKYYALLCATSAYESNLQKIAKAQEKLAQKPATTSIRPNKPIESIAEELRHAYFYSRNMAAQRR